MKLTKLRAAPDRAYKVPPCARATVWTRAPLRSLSPVFGRPSVRERVSTNHVITSGVIAFHSTADEWRPTMRPWQAFNPVWPIALLLAGATVGIVGNLMTWAWRRSGQTLASLFWAGSDLAARPERFVRTDRVVVVRITYYAGVLLFLLGVLMHVVEAVRRAT